MRYVTKIGLLAVAFCFGATAVPAEPAQGVTAILGALGEEVQAIQDQMQDAKPQTFLGIPMTVGTLAGRPVVVARSGAGKVNAAMTVTLVLDHFHPAEVVFCGVAGGVNPKLRPGDIVISEKLAQHDLGDLLPEGFKPNGMANPVTGQHNPVWFPADARLVALAKEAAARVTLPPAPDKNGTRTPQVIAGAIVTGDLFVAAPAKTAELRERFQADAVEMEGAAVAQVCYEQGVPFVAIRTLSDSADAEAQVDFAQYCALAARNSALLMHKLAEMLAHDAQAAKR